ncbi:MAG: Bax inhibitor-1 family protein [Patescibacteria group bacterium]
MNQIIQAEARSASSPTFFARTMGYFALALAAAAGGTMTGMFWLPGNLLASRAFMFGMFALTLILVLTSRKWSLGRFGYLFLILFAGILGITLVPLLALAALTAGSAVLVKALFAAVSMFAGMAIFGATTHKDLTGIGGFLMASLIGMIVVTLLTFILQFFGISVWGNGIELIFSGFGILIFAGFTAYDFQKIRNRDMSISPIQAAISLFLDFILLFEYILRFMTAMSRE